jgi:ribosomal protein S18 acetylase RimI-like enzyme
MIRCAHKEDWTSFLKLATIEGWRVPQLESSLFLGAWREHAYALVDEELFCGLVTAVPHQESGWIGNLIVPADLRGRGYGKQLFDAAVERLNSQGIGSIWLTASRLGQPIYEKDGFVEVGEIERWISKSRSSSGCQQGAAAAELAQLHAADQIAWGEQRSALLDAVASQGQVIACSGAAALLQREDGLQVLGPWYGAADDLSAHRELLQVATNLADPETELVVDLLTSSPVKQLLPEYGFHCTGRNSLMVKGGVDGVNLSAMVSLASLGSLG